MDSNLVHEVAAAIREYNPHCARVEAEALADSIPVWLTRAGYTVVKLPDMVVDEDGFKTWPVISPGRGAHVWRKRSDGTISLDGVHTSGMSAAQAWSLAAGLLAAVKYVEEEQ